MGRRPAWMMRVSDRDTLFIHQWAHLFKRKNEKKNINFGTTIHNTPSSQLDGLIIYSGDRLEKMTEQVSSLSLDFYIYFFFSIFLHFFSLFLRCCINSFPSCDVFTYLNTAYLSSSSLYTYYLSVWVIFFFSTWRGIKNVLMSLDGTFLERSPSS